MTRVTVVQEQRIIGWPDEPGAEPRPQDRAYVLPLGKALARSYTTDAHFAQYVTPNGRRLKIAAAALLRVQLGVIVLDLDCAAAHASGEPAPESWRIDVRRQATALLRAHGRGYYYETRGGARIVYLQPAPYEIGSPADALQWRQDYAITCAWMRRNFGLEVDVACSDWTRLFRLPRATRKGSTAPEDYLTLGRSDNIGPLVFAPEPTDLDLARELLPRAFDERRSTFAPELADGNGVLFHALRARGAILRPLSGKAYVIRCPNEAQHSAGGKAKDRGTVLYLPSTGQAIGLVHCLHAHCANTKPVDWLKHFSRDELSAADAAMKGK